MSCNVAEIFSCLSEFGKTGATVFPVYIVQINSLFKFNFFFSIAIILETVGTHSRAVIRKMIRADTNELTVVSPFHFSICYFL